MDNFDNFTDFQLYLKQKNLSSNTIFSYCSAVRLFYSYYPKLTVSNLNAFRSRLIEQYKPATVNHHIYAMNRYVAFFLEKKNGCRALRQNPKLPPVKMQQVSFLDSVISNEDYEKLKRGLKRDHNDLWYFVVHFLASTGARVSELVLMKAEHLRLGYVDLCSKGGKIRRIYLTDELCGEATEWCGRRGQTSGFLFLNRYGKPITVRGIHFQLKSLAVRYGINPDTVYPHAFRHRFAINFLNRFNDIALLADLLGHESIETTRIYLKKSSVEQQKLLDQIITW